MNSIEFQAQSREVLEHTLNQLQAATLLIAQLESQISEAGRSVQGLSQMIEQYVRITTNDAVNPSETTIESDEAQENDEAAE
jgi:predicted nuclease of restriction endonuclease-like RecB superfamily